MKGLRVASVLYNKVKRVGGDRPLEKDDVIGITEIRINGKAIVESHK